MPTASHHIRLVLFVLAGLACLAATLVLLGQRQNLFGSSLAVRADFRNVSGLLTGNNVRLAGITVGTVKKINILNDSTVRVIMHLNRDVQPYVRKNAVASVGTDGLVGNTIVNLTAVAAPAPLIAEGDVLRTTTPPAIDEMLATLSVSNKNLVGITADLHQITGKLNGSRALWELLGDHKVAADVRQSLSHVAAAATQLRSATHDAAVLTHGVRQGRGPLGYLLTDKAFAGQVGHATRQLGHATQQLAGTSDTLAAAVAGLKQQVLAGGGPAHTLLTDTAASRNLRRTLRNAAQGTHKLDESMEALKHNFLLRGYFRKQAKKKAKAASEQTDPEAGPSPK